MCFLSHRHNRRQLYLVAAKTEGAKMDEYRRLFEFLRLPRVAMDIALGEVLLPLHNRETPFDAYGFVPALLPLWIGQGVNYTGYWKHWFGSRQMTLVEVTVEDNRHAEEVARDFNQLACEVVLDAVGEAQGLTPQVRTFGTQAGISTAELEQIEQVWQEWRHERAGLLSVPRFASAAPLVCLVVEENYTDYTGDFPYDAMLLNEETLRNMCTTETSRELHQRAATLPFAPPWFTTTEQGPVFYQLLREKDHLGAWMSLNSTGWRFLEAKDALRQLAQEANVPGLDLLAEAWTAVPHEKNGFSPQTASY